MTRRLSLLARAICAIALAATGVSRAQSTRTHHVPDAVSSYTAQPIGLLPSSQIMRLDAVLPLRDPAGLESLVRDITDPRSPNYRHFLSVQEFIARFGPAQKEYDEVVRFVQSYGFTVTGGSRDGLDVQFEGPVSSVEAAFHLLMRTFQHPTENRTFYAPDQEPLHALPFNLWHISGLDNYSIPHPLFVKKSDYAKAHNIPEAEVVSNATTGSGPSASFLGSDMRGAYYGGALTGAGQNLGLLEYLGTNLADLNTYYKNVGQTNTVPVTLLSTDGTSTSCSAPGCDDIEQTLDMTQALGMAPGLASLVVYVGSSDTAIISAMTTHNPLPTTIGCSWGWTPVDPSTLDPFFQRMAAQGQNFFAASGDSSTWSSRVVAWPADDPYVVSVGGTDLVTASAGGPWQSETAWVDSGGGISPDHIAIPAWQQLAGVINASNRGSTTLRNGPDVSANANFSFYVCGDQTTCTANAYGGTSFAAPMWAGYIALVNQQLAANGKPSLGFLNPTIYAQNVTSSYAANFHDIASGTSGSFSAVAGFDLVTGWGSPNAGLFAALAGSTNPGFSLSASPASVTVAQGSAGNSTIASTVTGGFSSAIALAASGQPAGVTAGFSPASIAGAGSSAMTISVASSAAAGTYPITVTGTSGSTVATATVTLTVTAPAVLTSIRVTPANPSVPVNGTQQFTATGLDQSGNPLSPQPTFTWSVSGGGAISAAGLFTAGSTAGGPFTVTATSGSVNGTTSVTVTSVAANFSLTVSPASQSVRRGSTATYTVTIHPSNGFSGAVTLSLAGQPSGSTVTFTPNPGTTTASLTVRTLSSTSRKTYSLTITGVSGSLSHTTTASLTVTR